VKVPSIHIDILVIHDIYVKFCPWSVVCERADKNSDYLAAPPSGSDIRDIQQLLGPKAVSTTMIYTHVLPRGRPLGVQSPRPSAAAAVTDALRRLDRPVRTVIIGCCRAPAAVSGFTQFSIVVVLDS
jgi:hypothetical protein